MKNIINLELKKRDEERKERFGEIIEKKPNDPKYNFNELVEKYENGENIEMILNNLQNK